MELSASPSDIRLEFMWVRKWLLTAGDKEETVPGSAPAFLFAHLYNVPGGSSTNSPSLVGGICCSASGHLSARSFLSCGLSEASFTWRRV